MNTNKSKFNHYDLTEVRKDLNPHLTPKQARKENRELRKRIVRKTRSRENQEFKKLIDNQDYDDCEDFWKK